MFKNEQESFASKCDILKRSNFLKSLNDEAINLLANKLVRVNYPKGYPIFVEHESSKSIYFIEQGMVEIVRYQTSTRQLNRIGVIQQGEHFSELSVILGENHSVSTFAAVDCIILVLDAKFFINLIKSNLYIANELLRSIAQLNHSMYGLNTFTQHNSEFECQYDARMKELLPLTIIIKYMVLPVAINGSIFEVAMVAAGPSKFADEFSLRYPNMKLHIYSIRQEQFNEFLPMVQDYYAEATPLIKAAEATNHSKTMPDVYSLIHKTKLFSNQLAELWPAVKSFFEEITLPADQIVFTKGSASDEVYIVRSGIVEMAREINLKARQIVVTRTEGSVFGLASLMLDKPRALNAYTKTPTTLVVLKKQYIKELTSDTNFCLGLCQFLARRVRLMNSVVNLEYFEINTDVELAKVVKLLPLHLIESLMVFPLQFKAHEVIIGVVKPENVEIYPALHRALEGYRIHIKVLKKSDYATLLQSLKRFSGTRQDTLDARKRRLTTTANPTHDIEQFCEEILYVGILQRASDIHIEPWPKEYTVRYRIDGVLQELVDRIPNKDGARLINRLKILSNLDISQHRMPQDGQLNAKIIDTNLHARLSIMPTKHGENAVIRLIKPDLALIPLNMLAYNTHTIQVFRKIIGFRQGMIVVSGPTGSGKTMTLYSMLSAIVSPDRHVLTIEDPIEANIEGITQIEINSVAGFTLPRALRHVLRQDPDVIMVGEIRDAESAQLAFHAALTGHLVLTTLHTDNSLHIAARLNALGVSFDTIASGVILSIAQRLVRALCSKCKTRRKISLYEQERMAAELPREEIPDYVCQAHGCSECLETGYYDRIPVYEYWENTPEVKEKLRMGCTTSEVRQVVTAQGFRDIYKYGLQMVACGLTSFEEIDKTLYGLGNSGK